MSGYRSLLKSKELIKTQALIKLKEKSRLNLPTTFYTIPSGEGSIYIDGEKVD